MKVTARIADIKRHTLGYVINKETFTRYEAVQLAREGLLEGVKATRTGKIAHLVGTEKSLYDLPVKISTPHRMRNRRTELRSY